MEYFENFKIKSKIKRLNIIKSEIDKAIGVSLINKDTDKVGFFFSSFFHFVILFAILGMPTCFQQKQLEIPNIIPIEILDIDTLTRVPQDPEEEKIDEQEINKNSKIVRFSSSEQTEITKIEPKKVEKKEDFNEKNIDVIPKEKKIDIKESIKNNMKEEKIIEKYEALPTKKIKPKIKPKPIEVQKVESDVVVKMKKKPKPNFNIASVLKDLRQENIQLEAEDQEDEKDKKNEESKKQKANKFTISEIDLIKQQLYGCWNVPAGINQEQAKNIVVPVKIKVNPDRTVSNARIIDTNDMQSNAVYRSVAESALRAVLSPDCSPLKLPPEKYEVIRLFKIL